MTTHPVRHTARLLILDPADRLLMISYAAPHDLEPGRRTFWFTPGGGIEPGESAEQAALREMEEEVGLTGLPLLGEVARRSALNDMFLRAALCHERYFLVRATSDAFDTSRLAETDQDPVHAVRWWEIDALLMSDEIIIPRAILTVARQAVLTGPPARPVEIA
jgi:8-oxo-dGTP pyrophosphatase MutT (NUDIX family)